MLRVRYSRTTEGVKQIFRIAHASRLLKHGASIEEVRLLIQVPATQEKTLRTFAVENPLAGRMFLAVIEFRRRVLQQFDRLTAAPIKTCAGSVMPSDTCKTCVLHARGKNVVLPVSATS